MLDLGADVDALEEAGDQRHLQPQLVAPAHDWNEVRVRAAGGQKRQDDVLGPGALDDRLELVRAAQHRLAASRYLLLGWRVGVDVADRLEAQLGTLLEPPLHLGADAAGADDQRRLSHQALLAGPALGHPQDVAAAGHVDHPEGPHPGDQLGLAGGAPREERDQGDDDHRRDRARSDQVPDLVDVLHRDLGPVEPPDREQGDDDRREGPGEPRLGGVDVSRVRPDQRRDDREDQHHRVRGDGRGRPSASGEDPAGPGRQPPRLGLGRLRLSGGLGQRLVRERALGLRRRVGRACGRESKLVSSALAGSRHPITLSAHYRGGPPECLVQTG